MNIWNGTGRIFTEPRVYKYGPNNEKEKVRFTLACKREYRENGKYKYNFIPCVCYLPDKLDLIKRAVQTGIFAHVEGELYYENNEHKESHEFKVFVEMRVRNITFGLIPVTMSQLEQPEGEVNIDW